MKRKDFLYLTGMGISASMLSQFSAVGSPIVPGTRMRDVDVAIKKRMSDVALNAARAKGATYTDVRLGRYLNEFVVTRDKNIENIVDTESYGMGIRVIANGCWGFAATDKLDNDSIARAAETAVAIAKENSRIQSEPVQLAPQKGYGEVTWKTPIERNAFEVPMKEKTDLLLSVNDAAFKNGANYVNSVLFLVNEQKYFASTDGSYIDQDIHRIWPVFGVTKIDDKSGKFETRSSLSAPRGMGYEYLMPKASEKIKSQTTLYRDRYDMLEDAGAAALQVAEKLKAKTVEPGKYDLVLDPSHLWLTIHESVGHPSELDRVLGYEANFAGTSFLTLDKWKTGKFNFGSKNVNIVADKLQPGSLGAVGYDDEGVGTKQWDIIKDGILVNYQAIRDQAHIIGLKESQGCCYAQSWKDVQFQRMPNISLQPGKEKMSPADMIKNVEKGIYIIGDSSFSIDQQRYNFQFSGQLYYEIKNGKIVGMLNDVAYQANTQEFWNSCTAVCDKDDYRLGGSFFDGKGQPMQSSAVSHGSSTARFNGVNVINTARKI
ncbi:MULTISPECIES: TldD/PmbA family protein [unclassified Mucilaginibacter]|uniref:TldD/PmbA family protein n=1 Tax=unclassified Mucilaginibacter TaxID=2617802 RepID=UPI002AC8F51B|nr:MULTISPECIES: TldD/PmbA family protein [unclassified Mucilaginibacter]MEB0248512.1 TldD/PmbA family protein [Mucilaginibacter sp. 5B2]MEB0261162.1 TldD/PmbA family protein [Mucilaginibacter sp. 10I4]MEB0280334.1 TldD/PmbA family protein [Mucilaginibacter sp. 10B2]MEB0300355.1 TldD/PmbA family protein [Mucilaginibacter sp. 5C4]WPX24575.1 TldD/PmbA family protein [Mucilaginibacter sp. 5C4]